MGAQRYTGMFLRNKIRMGVQMADNLQRSQVAGDLTADGCILIYRTSRPDAPLVPMQFGRVLVTWQTAHRAKRFGWCMVIQNIHHPGWVLIERVA